MNEFPFINVIAVAVSFLLFCQGIGFLILQYKGKPLQKTIDDLVIENVALMNKVSSLIDNCDELKNEITKLNNVNSKQ